MWKALGKNPSGKHLEKVTKSSNYRGGVFQNIEPTEMMIKGVSFFKIFNEFFINRPKNITPKVTLPTIKTDLKNLQANTPKVVWFGHSSYLIAYMDARILVDPVFTNASPVPFFVKPFSGTKVYAPSDMPQIDILILTHDHYDHMDYKTIMNLDIKKIVCSLGVRSHLEYWGFSSGIISELDWNEKTTLDVFTITALPARHFSGRTLGRNKTIWNSYVLAFDTYKLFLGGDSGYDGQFKKTGDMYGPFDLAFVECGQYGTNWPYIHMAPEQTAQAAADLKTNVLFPVHWAKFALALHPWNDPIKRLRIAAQSLNYKIVSPQIGQVYTLGETFSQEDWWNI